MEPWMARSSALPCGTFSCAARPWCVRETALAGRAAAWCAPLVTDEAEAPHFADDEILSSAFRRLFDRTHACRLRWWFVQHGEQLAEGVSDRENLAHSWRLFEARPSCPDAGQLSDGRSDLSRSASDGGGHFQRQRTDHVGYGMGDARRDRQGAGLLFEQAEPGRLEHPVQWHGQWIVLGHLQSQEQHELRGHPRR